MFKLYLNKKGQVSAPFEVLVAVVLMGFVIVAGSFAVSNLSKNVCIGNKRSDISNFKEALRDVVLGSDLSVRNVNFTTKPCYNQNHEIIRLSTYIDPIRCAAYCGGGSSCTLMEYLYDDEIKQIRFYPIDPLCLDLPSAINFGSESKCINEGEEGWEVLTVPEGGRADIIIKPGIYRMFKRTSDDAISQEICVLRKVRN